MHIIFGMELWILFKGVWLGWRILSSSAWVMKWAVSGKQRLSTVFFRSPQFGWRTSVAGRSLSLPLLYYLQTSRLTYLIILSIIGWSPRRHHGNLDCHRRPQQSPKASPIVVYQSLTPHKEVPYEAFSAIRNFESAMEKLWMRYSTASVLVCLRKVSEEASTLQFSIGRIGGSQNSYQVKNDGQI
jgi:hypothetical protein